MNNETRKTVEALREGAISVEEALLAIKNEPFRNIDYAKIDTQRGIRQGIPEVVYGPDKPKEQLGGIVGEMLASGQKIILVTRLEKEAADYLCGLYPMRYDPVSRLGVVGDFPEPDGLGTVLVVTAGTGDIPVAVEAAVTAEALGNRVRRIYDLGVSTPQLTKTSSAW